MGHELEISLGYNSLHFDRLCSTEYSSSLLFTFDRTGVQHPGIFASAGLFVGIEQIGFPIRFSDCGVERLAIHARRMSSILT